MTSNSEEKQNTTLPLIPVDVKEVKITFPPEILARILIAEVLPLAKRDHVKAEHMPELYNTITEVAFLTCTKFHRPDIIHAHFLFDYYLQHHTCPLVSVLSLWAACMFLSLSDLSDKAYTDLQVAKYLLGRPEAELKKALTSELRCAENALLLDDGAVMYTPFDEAQTLIKMNNINLVTFDLIMISLRFDVGPEIGQRADDQALSDTINWSKMRNNPTEWPIDRILKCIAVYICDLSEDNMNPEEFIEAVNERSIKTHTSLDASPGTGMRDTVLSTRYVTGTKPDNATPSTPPTVTSSQPDPNDEGDCTEPNILNQPNGEMWPSQVRAQISTSRGTKRKLGDSGCVDQDSENDLHRVRMAKAT